MMRDKKLKSLKVLLVEDELEIAKLLKSAIGDSFRSFLLAGDGVEGYEIYKKTSPDIIISDIMMPNMNGLDMAKKIRSEDKNIPILILSAFSEKEKLLSAIDTGVNKYFIKPYNPREILEYIYSIADSFEQKIVALKDGFSFNKNTLSLYKAKNFIKLGKNETKFVHSLVLSEDNILTYDECKKIIWDDEVSDERLRTFVKRLREKTSKDFIQTIKGRGYKLI
jgi:DNA-binding response OmpR family regulator